MAFSFGLDEGVSFDSQLSSLQNQAGAVVGFELAQPPGTTDAIWQQVLQTIVDNGGKKFGQNLLQSLFQEPPQGSSPYGNLTGTTTGLLGGGVNISLSGGGGPSGPSAAEQRRMLEGTLKQSGFGVLPFNVSELIRETIQKKGNFQSLVTRIINDDRFTRAFPGLVDENGNLRMAPKQYVDQRNAFDELAAQHNVRLNKDIFGSLVSGEVSPNEFGVRLQALSTFRANREVFRAVNQILDRQGLDKLKKPKDVIDFIAGKKPTRFYNVYERASIQAAAEAAGVDIKGKRARKLTRKTAGVTSFEQAIGAFQQTRQQLQLASAELRRAGVSERELQDFAFGLAPELAPDVERVLQQRKTALEQPAAGQRLEEQDGRPVIAGGGRALQ